MDRRARKITLSGLFIALGLTLPFLTGQIPSIGNKLLPMHIPVLLAGFSLGGLHGLIVGLITPILRSFLFTMPPMPSAIAMAFELGTYGLITGISYKVLSRNRLSILIGLIMAMISGRIVWGIVSYFIFGLQGNAFNMQIFLTATIINAIPGIIIQIVLIPIIVSILERANLIDNR